MGGEIEVWIEVYDYEVINDPSRLFPQLLIRTHELGGGTDREDRESWVSTHLLFRILADPIHWWIMFGPLYPKER